MERDRKIYDKKLKAAQSNEERINLQSEFVQCTLGEWQEWLTNIDDKELINRARKADVYLDDIPHAEHDEQDMHSLKNSHYYVGSFGDMLLDPTVKKSLTQTYRKRHPEYRKECKEIIGIWVQIGGAFTGILGALTGLIVVYNKCSLGN